MSWYLTAFADEISPDLEVQLAELKGRGVEGLDLRSVDGVNVLDLTDAQLGRIKTRSQAEGIRIQCIGSPVNKVVYSPLARQEELEKLRVAVRMAHALGVERIRVFSPETANSGFAEAVLDWMAEQRDLASAEDVILLHENDAQYWGAYPKNARRLFEALGNTHFRAAFDFSNTVLVGFRPWDDWFPWIFPYLDALHIKDAIEIGQRIVPAGEGDGQILRTLKYLKEQGWSGPLTLEPHLSAGGLYGGFSGERLFRVAAEALKNLLAEVDS